MNLSLGRRLAELRVVVRRAWVAGDDGAAVEKRADEVRRGGIVLNPARPADLGTGLRIADSVVVGSRGSSQAGHDACRRVVAEPPQKAREVVGDCDVLRRRPHCYVHAFRTGRGDEPACAGEVGAGPGAGCGTPTSVGAVGSVTGEV